MRISASPSASPNDYEALGSQGPITLHGEERLVSSERGIVLLCRLFRKQMEIVANGGGPFGGAFASGSDLRHVEAGSFIVQPEAFAAE